MLNACLHHHRHMVHAFVPVTPVKMLMMENEMAPFVYMLKSRFSSCLYPVHHMALCHGCHAQALHAGMQYIILLWSKSCWFD